MEAQNPPSKMARVAEPEEMGSMRGVSSLIGLGFGSRPLNYGKSGFTFLQFQELEHQALIYKYMVAGVSVPIHLVLPIWKSVVNSYGGVNGGIYQHYPSFLGSSSLCFDYRNSVEPEPGRCRRTDGKKWRCSKDVVPDQKYCERHMHRGRNRSRKPVETSQVTTAAATIDNTNNNMNSNTNLSISIPGSLQLLTNSTTTTSSVSSGNLNSGNVLQSGSCKTESSL